MSSRALEAPRRFTRYLAMRSVCPAGVPLGNYSQHLFDAQLAADDTLDRSAEQRVHTFFDGEVLDLRARCALEDQAADSFGDGHDLENRQAAAVAGIPAGR